MKKGKRYLSMILTAAMVTILFTGCGTKQGETQSVEKEGETEIEREAEAVKGTDEDAEPLKITAWFKYQPSPLIPDITSWEQQVLWQTVEEKFNVDIEWNHADQELALMISSGEMADMLVGVSPTDANLYGTDGAFKDLSGIIANMPVLQTWFGKLEGVEPMITYSDGSQYFFPRIVYDSASTWAGWMANKNLLETAGVDISTMDTPEGMYEALKKYKEFDPESYPLRTVDKDYVMVYNWFCTAANTYDVVDGDQALYTPLTEEYRKATEYLKKLYEEKLISPEFLNDEAGAVTQAFIDEKSVVTMGSWVGRLENFNSQMEAAGVEPGLIGILAPSTKEKERWNTLAHLNVDATTGVVVSAAASDEVAERIGRIMDWLYDQSEGGGYEILIHGVEGEHWSKGDNFVPGESGYEITDELLNDPLYVDNATYFNNVIGNKSMLPTAYGTDCMLILYKSEAGLTAFTEIGPADFVQHRYPVFTFEKEDNDKKAQIMADLNTYVEETTVSFILGTQDLNDDTWGRFVQTMKDMGAEEYQSLLQKYYDGYLTR